MKNKIYIIGAGGVGSWLTPAVCLLASDPQLVTVIDGDDLEEKNLNRQLFDEEDIGRNKALALGAKYKCPAMPEYFHRASIPDLQPEDVLLVCVDNHPARKEALAAADQAGAYVYIGANETTSAEAFYYRPGWKLSRLDPRVYYPEIETDTGGNPIAARIGCTGDAQRATPQLVSANFQAAALMQQLLVLWWMKLPLLDKEVIPNLPYRLRANMSALSFDKVGNLEEI